MDPVGVSLTAVATAAAGVVAFALQRKIEYKHRLRSEGKLETVKKWNLDRYDALRRVKGELSEVRHCLMHLSNGIDVQEYASKARDHCSELRRFSREETSVLGEPFVDALRDETDLVLMLVDELARGELGTATRRELERARATRQAACNDRRRHSRHRPA